MMLKHGLSAVFVLAAHGFVAWMAFEALRFAAGGTIGFVAGTIAGALRGKTLGDRYANAFGGGTLGLMAGLAVSGIVGAP